MINNGFIKDKDGAWHNLSHIIRLRVMETSNSSFAIFAIMNATQSLVQISSDWKDEIDAFEELHHLMGYVL